ncbi:late competence development ComFB family protein [Viridibacillus sp. YIM B01967]|uniref:Late competence development ComFB family protein n=2 Tax=Viridibacillus soli TaxID=2798301 RepID=A0ABS1H5G8_9BACL|nr:late competence development ComFB family protein [Viridibacillus soli]
MKPSTVTEEAKLLNVTEEIVRGLVAFSLHGPDYPTFCRCRKCELDINAITLNHLDNHFVTTKEDREKAYAILKKPDSIALINKHIIRAIHIVGQKPVH